MSYDDNYELKMEVKALRREVEELRELVGDLLSGMKTAKVEEDDNLENEEQFMEQKHEQDIATPEFNMQCHRFCNKSNGLYHIGGVSLARLKEIKRYYDRTGILVTYKNFDNTAANIDKLKTFVKYFIFE